MADYLINIFLDDAKRKQIEGAGLADKIIDKLNMLKAEFSMTLNAVKNVILMDKLPF